MVSVVLTQSGDPCVIELEIINNSSFFTVSSNLIDFTNATCTSCPNVRAGMTRVWTVTAAFACDVPGSTAAIGGDLGNTCDNNSVCSFTGINLLPVEWTTFKAYPDREHIRLEWLIATELDNAGFEVQRSADGIGWQPIGFVAGRGTSQVPHLYKFTDPYPLPDFNYYRLKQLDLDGQFEYSDIVSAKVGEERAVVRIYPNPASTELNFALQGVEKGPVSLRMYDLNGRRVKAGDYDLEAGSFRLPLDIRDLPSGIYLTEVITKSGYWKDKINIY